MLRGCQKQMIVLQTGQSALFESAFFVLRHEKTEVLAMKNYYGYNVSDDVMDFITDMHNYIETNFGFAIESSDHHIYIDPIEDHIQVKSSETIFSKYSELKDFLLNFELEGKKIIELLEEFDFA